MISIKYEYATLFTIHRLMNHMSLRDLAKELGVSHVQISNYEKKLDVIPSDKLTKLYEIFCFTLKEDDNILELLQNHINLFLEKLFYRTLNYATFLKELEKYKDNYISSFYCRWYILMIFICSLGINDMEKARESKEIIEKIEMLGLEKKIFNHYRGIYEYNLGNSENAIMRFNEALRITPNEKFDAMSNYCLSIILANTGKYYDASEKLQAALLVFSKYGITSLIINANMELGNIYLKTRRFKLALEKYNDVREMMIINNSSMNAVASIDHNIALTHIYLKEYPSALLILNRYYMHNPSNIKIVLLHAMCYVMMDSFVDAMTWIKRGLDLTSRDMTEYYIFKIYKVVVAKERTKKALDSILRYYHRIEDKITSDQKYNYLTWIIEIAEARGDYRTADIYLKKKMSCI